MRVLVTGATGFVGGHLVPRLVTAGHEVLALGQDAGRLARLSGATPVVFDLRERGLAQVLPAQMDAIVHLAQWNGPLPQTAVDLFEVNAGSTLRLLDYARRAGVRRFVLASTGSVYGGGERPFREGDREAGFDLYAATKLAAERATIALGQDVPYTIFRLFSPYGPGQSGRLVPGLIDRVRAGQAVILREGGRPRRNPLFVDHVVAVLEQALAARDNQIVNLAGDAVLSIRDMAEIIGHVLGREPVFEAMPGPAGGDTIGDIELLRRLYVLPSRLTTFAEGVRAMVEHQPSTVTLDG